MRELYGRADFEFNLDSGLPILELPEGVLNFETLENGSIRVSDHSGSIIITPRTTDSSREGAAE